MSIADKLTKLNTDITNAYNSISVKGGTIPTNKNTENLSSSIESITGGGATVYTVTFDSDGGSEVASQQIVSGYTVKEPDTPTKVDYKFSYWALNGVEYDFDTPVTSNITLVAIWKEDVEYTKLEYIESTGTQYIDTKCLPTSEIAIEIDFQIIGASTSDTWQPIFGFRKYGTDIKTDIASYYNLSQKTMLAYAHGSDDLNTIDSGTPLTQAVNNRTQLRFDNTGAYENGVQRIAVSEKEFAETDEQNSIVLFAISTFNESYNRRALERKQKMKLYSMKFYKGEELIKNFIPVLDTSNVACLYDKVSKTYLYNAGTGSFTAGSVIS